jgi:predicted O-methyltransferase YrrM
MLRQSVKNIYVTELDIKRIEWRPELHREYLNLGEMEIIVALLRKLGARSMVEIGCRDGRTARVLLDNVPTLQSYVGVDVPTSYQPSLASQRSEIVGRPGRYVLDDERFELIIRPYGSLDLQPDDIGQCDAVFIDGDHSEDAVSFDSQLAHGAVREGGMIIWHDYTSNHFDDVTRVLNGLAETGWPIHHVVGTWLAFCPR